VLWLHAPRGDPLSQRSSSTIGPRALWVPGASLDTKTGGFRVEGFRA
jgi:hypothetical protein